MLCIGQLAGAVEYPNCTSAEGLEPSNDCPGYHAKESDGDVPVMLELWGNGEHAFIAIALRFTLARSGSNL